MGAPPNKIKYSSDFHQNAIKTKGFVLGINTEGNYGPTSSTGFWNGITPPQNGYTIYMNKAILGPAICCPNNDSELINFANGLGGGNLTTINQAIGFINNLGNDHLCVNIDYPDIVTSGLLFCVDAGFVPSYQRTGSTWTDISFSGNNATFVNLANFVLSGKSGFFDFQSVNSHYATIPEVGSLSNFSTEVWVKQNSLAASNTYPSFISNTFPGGSYVNYALGYLKAPWDGKIYGGFFNNAWQLPSVGFTPTTNQWYHYAVTFDGTNIIFYVDGTYYSSGTTSSAAVTSGSGGRLMRRWDSADYIDGYMLNSKIYNRALTATEVKQNFNAHSLPLGTITSNLVLNYDAGNVLSYPGTGTIWKNMASPTTNNGILINGPTYNSANGGSIIFDGSNDYVSGGTGNMGLDLSDKSFQCWIKTNGLAHYGIIDKEFDTAPGVYGGWGFWINGSGKLWFWNHSNLDLIDNGALSVANGTWTNVAVTYNSTTKSAKFYYNGVLNSTQTNANIVEISSGTQPLNIGCIRDGSAAFFNGNMSLLLAYNKVLTDSEILTNYNSSKFRYI